MDLSEGRYLELILLLIRADSAVNCCNEHIFLIFFFFGGGGGRGARKVYVRRSHNVHELEC